MLIRKNFYCTGYTYSYKFLDEKCGITVNDSMVEPLYLHFLNINRPTMCFIGIPRELPGFAMFDMQVSVAPILVMSTDYQYRKKKHKKNTS